MDVSFSGAVLSLSLHGPDGRRLSQRIPVDTLKLSETPRELNLGKLAPFARLTAAKPGAERLSISLYPKAPITLGACSLAGRLSLEAGASIFFNGYQSWTDGREQPAFGRTGRMGILGRLAEKLYRFSAYGDYSFGPQSRGPGHFCGWSWASFREGGRWTVVGSLSDHRGAFTGISASFGAIARLKAKLAGRRVRNGPNSAISATLRLSRDVQGKLLEPHDDGEGFELLNLGIFSGSENEAFDAWFAAQGIKARTLTQARGWTSWYKHYENVDQAKVRKAIEGYSPLAARHAGKTMVIQIDDGWQAATGDWLRVRADRFPDGLAQLAAEARASGCVPGLWLAPFAAAVGSSLASEHPEWLARDRAGRPIPGGSNWGGFWALDPLSSGLRDYLARVFDTVLGDWGFGLVKLDFLYAACMVPRAGLSRGELMAGAMDYLRKLCGPALMLACGVPLASAFGRSDYCRVGCDVGLSWDGSLAERFIHRERVSTRASIDNALARRQLNGRAFLNDPDVWIGRSGPEVRLNQEQKERLHGVNLAHGGLVFCSDDADEVPPGWL